MKKTQTTRCLLFLLAVLFASAPARGQTLAVLHTFTNGSDGSAPAGVLVLTANTLYGVASAGGSVFSFNFGSAVFNPIHTFNPTNDGSDPLGGLTLAGNGFYGTTHIGGSNNSGAIFYVNLDGAGFTNLYSFDKLSAPVSPTYTQSNTDGGYPFAPLLLSGGILYGGTEVGGTNGHGTVFSVDTNGQNFAVLHTFTNGADGASVDGALVLSGDTLYGTAVSGGASNGISGTIFALNLNGSGFRILHTFNDITDGSHPGAGLVLSGNTLYGTTEVGPTATNQGTIYSIKTDGSGFTNLHTFSPFNFSTNSDGGHGPRASISNTSRHVGFC